MSIRDELKFSIVTTEKVVYENIVHSVTVPTSSGEITVLPKHIPLVSTIGTGAIRIKSSEGEKTFAIAGGIIEVRRDSSIVVLAGNTEPAEEIDVERAQNAYDRAKEYLKEKRDVADVDYARMQSMLEKNLNRISIAKSFRKSR